MWSEHEPTIRQYRLSPRAKHSVQVDCDITAHHHRLFSFVFFDGQQVSSRSSNRPRNRCARKDAPDPVKRCTSSPTRKRNSESNRRPWTISSMFMTDSWKPSAPTTRSKPRGTNCRWSSVRITSPLSQRAHHSHATDLSGPKQVQVSAQSSARPPSLPSRCIADWEGDRKERSKSGFLRPSSH